MRGRSESSGEGLKINKSLVSKFESIIIYLQVTFSLKGMQGMQGMQINFLEDLPPRTRRRVERRHCLGHDNTKKPSQYHPNHANLARSTRQLVYLSRDNPSCDRPREPGLVRVVDPMRFTASGRLFADWLMDSSKPLPTGLSIRSRAFELTPPPTFGWRAHRGSPYVWGAGATKRVVPIARRGSTCRGAV